MEHFLDRMVKEVVLHQGGTGQLHVLRRGIHSREEGELDRPPGVRRSSGGSHEADRLVAPGRAWRGRQLHLPPGDALPEEGALGVRVCRKRGPDQDAVGDLGESGGTTAVERAV